MVRPETHSAKLLMTPPAFEPLRETESVWIANQLHAADQIVSLLSPGDAWNPLRLETLDRAWDVWLDSGKSHTDLVNEHLNAFGIAFGHLLVESGIFNWCIVTDEWGTDLGIRALPSRGDVSIVPVDFVAKRWERHERCFMADGYTSIIGHVEQTRREWDASK